MSNAVDIDSIAVQATDESRMSLRNHYNQSMRKDNFVEWIKEMMHHSFVLGNTTESYTTTMEYIEELIREHRAWSGISGTATRKTSRLKNLVPTVDVFHTELQLKEAFTRYNGKYAMTSRKHVPPTFNEIRHILNLSQLLAIGDKLKFISFDGDQTLYSDGGNFEEKSGLSYQIIELIKAGVIICVITAANYFHDGPKYEVRLQGLLRRFIKAGLSAEEVNRFYVVGGECNFLLQAHKRENEEGKFVARIEGVEHEVWQADIYNGPKPSKWPQEEITKVLDIAEASFRNSQKEMRLRARIIRKPTSIGIIPGGPKMIDEVPQGHGNEKLKSEALNEVVLRALDELNNMEQSVSFPYCAFNGGRDAWVDVGSKGVAVEALQAYFSIESESCVHIGDQFLKTGNDISARATCTTIWIENPKETFKILDHVLGISLGLDKMERAATEAKLDDEENSPRSSPRNVPAKVQSMNVYTGEFEA